MPPAHFLATPRIAEATEAPAQVSVSALTSLHAACAAIPVPRSGQGRRYDLPFLLMCLVAALLCA